MARASLRPVAVAEWWDRAGPAQIGVAWETANAWRHIDTNAQRTAERMRTSCAAATRSTSTVAKCLDRPYTAGRRSKDWVKLKLRRSETFLVTA
jgi:4-hydroxyphenylpyruvate dioxygenase-like putative hemolysin